MARGATMTSLQRTQISDLPIELIRLVFLWARSVSWKASNASPLPSQVLLTHVSRQWRTIAINTASLWTSIDIHKAWHVKGILDAHLARSEPHPLDISLRWDHVVEKIAACSHRWNTFRGYFSGWSSLGLFVEHIDAPRLKHLYLSADYPYDGGITIAAPHLSHLELTGVPLSLILGPLPDLRTCTIDTDDYYGPIDLVKLGSLFSSSPQLTELSIAYEALPFDLAAAGPVHIPSLTSLRLAAHEDEDLQSMCTALSVPALETLKLSGFDRGLLECFIDFIDTPEHALQIYPILRSLYLIDTRLTMEVMAVLPHITHVILDNADDECLTALRIDRQPPRYRGPLWPHLHSITASSVRVTYDNDLRAVVTSRTAAGCPLHSVSISSSGPWQLDTDLIPWLREHVASVSIDHVFSENI
ncbi:hypothetical protein PLICRDRAFT_179190 [Plicaturopsis crispa FD-325 SS-3]|uniref:F-box domain-containing protein n=1 Tax=Plicaturopsis crispa FD-325 SS-3 TaxID=944288 RepID=A0A0C9SY80_PLICR|nr:hypothetical protein PLICRDRAFT_179190 [Plicaturopsis crispa FD-325 SS-3]